MDHRSLGEPRVFERGLHDSRFAIQQQAAELIHMSGTDFYYEGQVRLAEDLAAVTPIDGGGYRTTFELRKEIWFGSIPLSDQGAVPVRISF